MVERDVSATNYEFVLDPKHVIALPLQPFIAFGVMTLLLFAFMRRAVKLHDEATLDAQEVDHIAAKRNLSPEFQSVESRTS